VASASNSWQLGVPYDFTMNGVPFWTQSAPFQPVFPTQQNGPWPEYPIAGGIINEFSPWWAPGCGHAIKLWRIFQEYDYVAGQPVSLICCNICTYIQQVAPLNGGAVADFDTQNVYNPYQQAIIFG
jgi:hypothetical protein